MEKTIDDLYHELYQSYIPNALKLLEDDGKKFDDSRILDQFHKPFDRFWKKYGLQFVRHSTFELYLEKVKSVDLRRPASGQPQPVESLLRTFIACEIELRISSHMTDTQKVSLGRLLYSTGCKLLSLDQWPSHASHCLWRASEIFGQLNDYSALDNCLYHRSRAEIRRKSRLHRIFGIFAYLLAGFGYRPYRLLGACIVVVILFSLIYRVTVPQWTLFDCFLFSSINYLAMLGYENIGGIPRLGQALVLFQGFLSLVLNSTFIALLGRKWFRF